MNFKRLSLVAVQAIALGLLPTAAFATTDTTFFQGTVPGSCTITGATSSSSPAALTYSTDANGTLSGTTDEIGINCNSANVSATLSAVDQAGNPTETSATAILLNSSEAAVITNSTTSTSAATAIGNANGSTSDYFISLDATGASVPGTYNFSVVLTTLE